MAKTGRPKAKLTVTGAERATLQRWARREPKDHNQAGLARRIKVKVKVNRPNVASDVTKTEVKIKGKKIKVKVKGQSQGQKPIKT